MNLQISPISFQAIKGVAETKKGEKTNIDLPDEAFLYRVSQDDGTFKLYHHIADRGMLHSNGYNDEETTYSKVIPLEDGNPDYKNIGLSEVSGMSVYKTLTMQQVDGLNANLERYQRGLK